MTYLEKLKSPQWQKKRLRVLERDKFTCCFCGDSDHPLNVHHSEYSQNPWYVDDASLVTLCEDCHEYTESVLKKVRELSKFYPNISTIQDLCKLLSHDDWCAVSMILSLLAWHPNKIKDVLVQCFQECVHEV